ncbi:hypothetical protein ACFQ9X_42775 [Catenulispora yoronensis]
MKNFRNLLAAEWIKMRSLRSMRWGLLIGILGVLWMNVNAALADYSNYHPSDQYRPADGLHDIFTNNAHMVALVVFGVLGAIVLVGSTAPASSAAPSPPCPTAERWWPRKSW